VQEHAHGGGTFFEFQPGPIFANVVLADEINRATPKTQSALLEAMQEQSVSVGKTTYQLEQPFLVLATQNPLEMEGTYPLPEAQLDRFFFKLKVTYPPEAALHQILERTTQTETTPVARVMDGPEILEMRHVVRSVPIAKPVQSYAIRLTLGSHPGSPHASPLVNKYVRYGASPRAAQALVLGRQDSRDHARPGLRICRRHSRGRDARVRHRLLLNFEGEAEQINADTIVTELLESVRAES
jgi:MoxR-like ATPase